LRMKILIHKAYSFATWTIVFAVLFAALAIIQKPLERGVAKKIKGTSDYLLWGQFGDEVEQHGQDKTSISKSKATSKVERIMSEEGGVFTSSIDSPDAKTTRVSAGVGEGMESTLKLIEDTYESTDLGQTHEEDLR